jgi:anti-sigma factor ChrR (cupin superfamily)
MSEQYSEKFQALLAVQSQRHRWKMQGIREYVLRVNTEAEVQIAKTGITEGAHHRAMISVLKELESRDGF